MSVFPQRVSSDNLTQLAKEKNTPLKQEVNKSSMGDLKPAGSDLDLDDFRWHISIHF